MKERQEESLEGMSISRIKNEIKKLPGVLFVNLIDPQIYEKIIELEDRYTQSTMNINMGILETLAREYQFCIFKNDDFRRPPSPTVLMVYKYDAKPRLPDEQIVQFGGMFYSIIGEEKNGHQKYDEDNVIDIGGFVIFRRRIVKGKKPIFLFPSVDFPELSGPREIKDVVVKDVVSSSPCVFTDKNLRKHYGYQGDPHHTGTLLLGFNLEFYRDPMKQM